jgi:DNA-binding Xre family transcriptional regulator
MAVDIQRAQQLLAKGLTPTQVAQRLGINSATARKIAAGKYREGSNAKN